MSSTEGQKSRNSSSGRLLDVVLVSMGLSLAGPVAAEAAEVSTKPIAAPKTLFGFNEDPVSSGYALQSKLNAPVRRLVVYWRQVEPRKGAWNWAASDAAYSKMISAGLKPLIVAFQAPCWAVADESCASGGGYPPDPSFDSDWARFIRLLTARYPKAIGIEIWNEPNLSALFKPAANPARYTALLRTAYTAVKSVNRTMPVVSGGLLPGNGTAGENAGGMADETFLQRMYANGAKGSLDAIGAHPYSAGATWSVSSTTQAIDQLRAARNAAGASSTPIWVTETGVPTATESGYPAAVSPPQQSSDLVQLVRYYAAQPDIPVALIHRLVDGPNAWSIESGFGVYASNLTPKPAACALSREWHGSLRC